MKTMRNTFIDQCRLVAAALGAQNDQAVYGEIVGCHYVGGCASGLVYEDDDVLIVSDSKSLAIAITRKANHNPIVSTEMDGEIIRAHGEHVHLLEHVQALVIQVLAQDRA